MFHSIQICQEIAKRLQTIPENLDSGFSNGSAGIACFYGKMDEVFPEEGWDKVAYTYLKQATHHIEKSGYQDLSLFEGLAGVCLAVHLCSKNGLLYEKLQSKLEAALLEGLETNFFPECEYYLNNEECVPPHLYNLSQGLSGILSYLLLRKEDPKIYQCILTILKVLCRLFNRQQELLGVRYPGWVVAPHHQLSEEERPKYPEGSFVLGMSFGITGSLAALAIASLEGIKTEELTQTIKLIADWLKEQKRETPYGLSWPHTISWNEQDNSQRNRDVWWSGIPAVSRSLYLAGKALENPELKNFAKESFISVFSKPPAEWNAMGTSLLHGRAGMLAISYQMAEEIQTPVLWQQVKILEEDLKTFYRPHSVYGFQSINVKPPAVYQWIDNPGFSIGASGIGLALLFAQGRGQLLWDRILLLK